MISSGWSSVGTLGGDGNTAGSTALTAFNNMINSIKQNDNDRAKLEQAAAINEANNRAAMAQIVEKGRLEEELARGNRAAQLQIAQIEDAAKRFAAVQGVKSSQIAAGATLADIQERKRQFDYLRQEDIKKQNAIKAYNQERLRAESPNLLNKEIGDIISKAGEKFFAMPPEERKDLVFNQDAYLTPEQRAQIDKNTQKYNLYSDPNMKAQTFANNILNLPGSEYLPQNVLTSTVDEAAKINQAQIDAKIKHKRLGDDVTNSFTRSGFQASSEAEMQGASKLAIATGQVLNKLSDYFPNDMLSGLDASKLDKTAWINILGAQIDPSTSLTETTTISTPLWNKETKETTNTSNKAGGGSGGSVHVYTVPGLRTGGDAAKLLNIYQEILSSDTVKSESIQKLMNNTTFKKIFSNIKGRDKYLSSAYTDLKQKEINVLTKAKEESQKNAMQASLDVEKAVLNPNKDSESTILRGLDIGIKNLSMNPSKTDFSKAIDDAIVTAKMNYDKNPLNPPNIENRYPILTLIKEKSPAFYNLFIDGNTHAYTFNRTFYKNLDKLSSDIDPANLTSPKSQAAINAIKNEYAKLMNVANFYNQNYDGLDLLKRKAPDKFRAIVKSMAQTLK